MSTSNKAAVIRKVLEKYGRQFAIKEWESMGQLIPDMK
jgi:hypothetical protein